VVASDSHSLHEKREFEIVGLLVPMQQPNTNLRRAAMHSICRSLLEQSHPPEPSNWQIRHKLLTTIPEPIHKDGLCLNLKLEDFQKRKHCCFGLSIKHVKESEKARQQE
jgi:hypothetical protein